MLVTMGILPSEGNFDVTEQLLFNHRQQYATLGEGNPRHELRCRRYAGVGLMHLKHYRKIPAKDIKEGILYLIKNPAWPNHTKVGISVDANKRLKSYQTYDPHRAYYIQSYEYVLNKYIAEKDVLALYSKNEDKGEWVSDANAEELIQHIRSQINYIKEF